MKEFLVEEKTTLKEFTDNTYAQASFWYHALLKAKEIRVNGLKVGKNVPLQQGDVVRYYLTKEQESLSAFEKIYEDGKVLVIDKESGVNSEAVFFALKSDGARFIHRLDRNTRGLMIFAKTDEAEEELLRLFRAQRVQKIYHALLFSCPKEGRATLTAYQKKDSKTALVKVYDQPVLGAEKMITEYEILAKKGEQTLVKVTLHTGKTHQIRAHFSHIGCPIIGDEKYGDSSKNKTYSVKRQCLVAKELSLQSRGCLSYLNGKIFTSRFSVDFFN